MRCTCPTWGHADDFDGPADYSLAVDLARCAVHGDEPPVDARDTALDPFGPWGAP